LNVGQCRETLGLRTKNEPLTADATLRQTARNAKHEDAKYGNARKMRKTTKRATNNNAGQPETTQNAKLMRSEKAPRATQLQVMLLCRLTLELSGGEAVRLERDVRAHLHCPSFCWLCAETLAECFVRG
jgi:hypothetical protein